MGLPQANLVLFFLAAFTGLWGVSVIFRGLRARHVPGTRRCPECEHDMRGTDSRCCPACGYEARGEGELQLRRRDIRVVAVGILSTTAGVALTPLAIWVRRWETTGYDDGLSMHPLHPVFYGVAAFGLALAAWAWRGDRSKGRRRCPKCWYDLGAIVSRVLEADPETPSPRPTTPPVCPECGYQTDSMRALYKPRRSGRTVLVGVALVAIGLYGQTAPRALRTGPLGLVPTTVLIAGAGWLPDWWYVSSGNRGTLEERVQEDMVWDWQRKWISRRFGAIARRDPLACDPASLSIFVDSTSNRGRTDVTLGLIRLLGNPDNVLTSTRADELTSLWEYTYTWLYEGEQTPEEVVEALESNREAIEQRAASAANQEAALCLQVLAVHVADPQAWIDTLAACARANPKQNPPIAGYMLAEFAEQEPAAIDTLLTLLDPDTGFGASAQWCVTVASRGARTDELREKLLQIVRSGRPPGLVAQAAEAFAFCYGHTAEFDQLAREPDLPPQVIGGLAEGWARSGRRPVAQLVGTLLPGLADDDPEVVFAVLFCLRRGSDRDQLRTSTDLMRAILPLLDHDSMFIRDAARDLLADLQPDHPALDEDAADD